MKLEDFKVGDIWLTRKEQKMEIIYLIPENTEYKIIGLTVLNRDRIKNTFTWTEEGRYVIEKISDHDLMCKWEPEKSVEIEL